MPYTFFLDETGDHGLSFVDENFPLFLLAGCIVEDEALLIFENDIRAFKMEFFKSEDVILHSRDIRKCEGPFQILFDLEIKARFYERLNAIITNTPFTIIGAAVNKKKHIEKYGKSARDPYALSLSFVLERFVFFLNRAQRGSTADIIIEKRGQKEDAQLLSQYNAVYDRGTYFVTESEMKTRVMNFTFKHKRENIIGLQLADLCAYPLARHVLSVNEPYVPFEVIKGKIYCNAKGETKGYGLKVFP
jgi:hypothetical protein